jgi:chromosome segregation ATPase
MIQKSKNKENMPDFDEMMSEVEGDIQEKDAEQDIVNRVPELKRLSANIDKAADTWVNAAIQLESAIQQYQRAELKLGNAVNSIGIKVDTINTHVDNLLRDAPDKLQVSVNVSDADWLRIQELFDKEHKWMLAKMQEHIREVNAMFVDERRKVQKRYKEYDGCYLGHYAQWFFCFFFALGFFLFTSVIIMMVYKWLHWF